MICLYSERTKYTVYHCVKCIYSAKHTIYQCVKCRQDARNVQFINIYRMQATFTIYQCVNVCTVEQKHTIY